MNTSRNLLMVCAALIVGLSVLCGKLWGQLQAEQQLVAELRANENVERKAVEPAPIPAPQLTADAVNALRSLFEAGHAQRLAAARADQDRIANGGN